MRVERLFLEKVRSLERDLRTKEDADYALIRAATTMYHLLVDGLLTQANRETRRAIRFHVFRDQGAKARNAGTLIIQDNTRIAAPPDVVDPDAVEDIPVRELLAYPVASYMMNHYTVRDFLAVAANALGGKHYGEPSRQSDAHLKPLFELGTDSLLSVTLPSGEDISLPPLVPHSIRRIGPVVVSGLAPLRDQLAARGD